MKKVLFISIFLLVPAVSHAQMRGTAGSAPPSNLGGGPGGVGGGYAGGGNGSVTPTIDRHHTSAGVTAYRNPGEFELTEILPWEKAIKLGEPKPEKSLAVIARETREERAKENNPARVTLEN
jgi:hypothetical protein